jgi:hypothetical protein
MGQGTTVVGEPEGHRGRGRPARLRVESGQRFARGVVIDADVPIPIKSRPGHAHRGARLLCDCGNEYTGTLQAITSGHLGSCGCLRKKGFVDRTGRRYGKLVVVQYAGMRDRKTGTSKHTLWLCRCDCGNESVVAGVNLGGKDGTRSCGCSITDRPPKLSPQVAGRNKVLATYRSAARTRGLSWELADEDFDRLMVQDCFYCGTPPSVITTPGRRTGDGFLHGGLDRKDNTLGYLAGNVVPCCITCNHAKMAMPFDAFMAWIAQLIAHHWFNPEMTPSRRLKAVI